MKRQFVFTASILTLAVGFIALSPKPPVEKIVATASITVLPTATPLPTVTPTPTTPPLPTATPIPTVVKRDFVSEVIYLVNQERVKYGLHALSYNGLLATGASARAKSLIETGQWSHDGYTTAVWNSGYHYIHAGENLGRGYSDPSELVRAWMASPTHRDNILTYDWQDMGIGTYGTYTVLWMGYR